MKTFIHSFAFLLAAWLCVVGTTSATAAPRVSTVLILPDGEESVDLLLSNAADAMTELNVGVTEFDDATLAGFEFSAALQCLNDDAAEDCSDVVRMVPAEWILLLRIRKVSDNPDSDQSLIAKLYSVKTADLLQVEQRVCKRCSSSERMSTLIRELTKEMAQTQLNTKARDTFIDVQSNPPGGVLTIDDVVVGPTGQAYRVTPGEHRIKVEHKGYRAAAQVVEVGANEHKALTVSLDSKPKPDRTKRLIGWAAIGTGALALTTGVTFIAIHEDAPGPDDPRVDSRNDSKGLGIAGVITGAVLLGAGAALLYTAETSAPNIGSATLNAAPTRDGFAVGLSGHF